MDDYNLSSLSESKNEWCARLVNTLTPAVIEGLRSIFKEAKDLCAKEGQEDKYLMTFQTYLSRIPKWNESIIKGERERIEEQSRCGYLEELITCVHVVQLKALTCVRVGQKQKAIDLDIPPANTFVHKVYTLAARRLYTSVYLFEEGVAPLEKQKLNRELETLVKECIMDAVRDSVPVDKILRAYVAQTEEEVPEDPTPPVPTPTPTPAPAPTPSSAVTAPPSVAPALEKKADPPADAATPIIKLDGPPASTSVEMKPMVLAGLSPTAPSPAPAQPPAPPSAPEVISLDAITTPPEVKKDIAQGSLGFSHTDRAIGTEGKEELVKAPKDDPGLRAAEVRREEKEAAEAAAASPVDDEPISLAIREMGGVKGLPDIDLGLSEVEVLA